MKMARLETAIRTVIDFNKAFNCHDVPHLISLVRDDCIFKNPDFFSEAASYTGKEELAEFLGNFFLANPQAHLEIEEIFGFSIHCVMRWRYDYVDALGTKQRLRGVDLFQVKNLLITERLTYLGK